MGSLRSLEKDMEIGMAKAGEVGRIHQGKQFEKGITV